jgi:hypothetical protein
MDDNEKEIETMNYNDRPDGYGFGEAECRDRAHEYEKDPHFTQHCIDPGEGYRRHLDEPFSWNEYGLRNPYGPVDQYTFRDLYFHELIRGKASRKGPGGQ